MAGVGGDFAPSVAGEEFVDDRGGDGFFQVLGERGAAWAFEADEVPGTVAGNSSDLLAAPLTVAATGAGFTKHLMPCATGHAGILDVDALLAACGEAVRA